ncbi:cytochrome P450 [Neobacillus fumarioli]|uniref:cytochrome P450 n=1 Tax=Neobacillus fumarioli TaxID=105229 RepID=UPI00082F0F52|nr:cytochrome P450 [Neobacillus fumarioli]
MTEKKVINLSSLTQMKEIDSNEKKLYPFPVYEELRKHNPVRFDPDRNCWDIFLYEKTIKKGDAVTIWVASANRDEAKFSQPNEFIIDRKPNPHLTFGKGIHFCLGAPLARLEAKIAFEGIFAKMKDLKLKEGAQIKRTPSPQMYGFVEYPIVFTRK